MAGSIKGSWVCREKSSASTGRHDAPRRSTHRRSDEMLGCPSAPSERLFLNMTLLNPRQENRKRPKGLPRMLAKLSQLPTRSALPRTSGRPSGSGQRWAERHVGSLWQNEGEARGSKVRWHVQGGACCFSRSWQCCWKLYGRARATRTEAIRCS